MRLRLRIATKHLERAEELVPLDLKAEDLTETGATGDPTRYDAELGRRIGERMTDLLADFLGQIWRDGQTPGTAPKGDQREEATD